MRNDTDNGRQQLTKYFNEVAGNDASIPSPAVSAFSIGAGAPIPEPPPGIEARTRQWVRQIKGHADYSKADGELLGIVAPETPPDNFAGMKPEFSVTTLANFELYVTFRKNGMDALKFEFRHKGGDWLPAGFLV